MSEKDRQSGRTGPPPPPTKFGPHRNGPIQQKAARGRMTPPTTKFGPVPKMRAASVTRPTLQAKFAPRPPLPPTGAVAQPIIETGLYILGGLALTSIVGYGLYSCFGGLPSGSIPRSDKDYLYIPKGHYLFHGTRWTKGEKEWWTNDTPNREDEDGGVSFTLQPSATPKVGNAQVVIAYKTTGSINAIFCKSKGDFYDILRRDVDAVCYATVEQEVKMTANAAKRYLTYYTHKMQAKTSTKTTFVNKGEEMV